VQFFGDKAESARATLNTVQYQVVSFLPVDVPAQRQPGMIVINRAQGSNFVKIELKRQHFGQFWQNMKQYRGSVVLSEIAHEVGKFKPDANNKLLREAQHTELAMKCFNMAKKCRPE
jgi:hypothetical protein